MSRVRRKRHREQTREATLAATPVVSMDDLAARRAAVEANRVAMWRVIQAHGRPLSPNWPDGARMRCKPSRAELEGEVPRRSAPGNDNKIIYDGRDIAEACARELEKLGNVPMRAYHCARKTTNGHWHLTVDGHHARRALDRIRRDEAALWEAAS